MCHVVVAAVSAAALLAGCVSGTPDRAATGTSGASAGASAAGTGSTFEHGWERENRIISPGESGMGEGPTRQSLTEPGKSASGAAPYPRSSRSWTGEEILSPGQSSMGDSQTRRSLPNTAGSGG